MEPYDIAAEQPWSRGYIEWRWADREAFRRLSYHATGLDRFKHDSDADIVMFADADVLFTAGVDDLLLALHHTPAVAGVIAHVPPFWGANGVRTDYSWKRLFQELGEPMPADRYEHTGWGIYYAEPAVRFAPAYFNFGAVFVPGRFMPELAKAYTDQLAKAEKSEVGYYSGQLALTLAISRLNLPRVALAVKYNFPNDAAFERRYPRDFEDVRIIHYLRTGVVDRRAIWETPDALNAFLRRKDLTGVNERLRQRIEQLAAGGGLL